ncbi:MAG: RHS repeat-associated core domain-containing protein [Chlorobiota bacterium]
MDDLANENKNNQNWIGKEKDKENGLGDHGVRKYEYETGRFTSIDPLWNNYYVWTPYQYSLNSSIELVDVNGLVVEALDAKAEEFIRLSVEEAYETAVTFDDGILDWEELKKKLPKDIDPNSNVATLVRLGQSSEVVTLSGKTGEFKFKNSKGEVFSRNIYDYKKFEPFVKGYDEFVAGFTILPYGDPSIKDEFTLSGNTEIYVNPTHNGGYWRSISKTTAHELFVHFRFHIMGIRHHHEEDRTNDPEYLKYWIRRYERQSVE